MSDDRPWPPTFRAWIRAVWTCRREGHAEFIGGYCTRCARGLATSGTEAGRESAPVAAPAGGEERG